MPVRTLRGLLAAAALVLAALGGWYYLMGTPQYSLYRFADAIHARDAADAWVTSTDPRRGQTRFRMSQQPARLWRIAEFDADWVRRHLKDGSAG